MAIKPDNRMLQKLMKSNRWAWRGWAWPVVVLALMLAKVIGLIAGVVAMVAYFAFKPRFGVGLAVAAAWTFALLAGVIVVDLLEGV